MNQPLISAEKRGVMSTLLKDYVKTDDLQWCKKVSDHEFDLVEVRLTQHEPDKFIVVTGSVDINDALSDEQIGDPTMGYYDSIDHPLVSMPARMPDEGNVYHLFPVLCPKRDQLQHYLTEQGIQTQIHYPIPPQPAGVLQGVERTATACHREAEQRGTEPAHESGSPRRPGPSGGRGRQWVQGMKKRVTTIAFCMQ